MLPPTAPPKSAASGDVASGQSPAQFARRRERPTIAPRLSAGFRRREILPLRTRDEFRDQDTRLATRRVDGMMGQAPRDRVGTDRIDNGDQQCEHQRTTDEHHSRRPSHRSFHSPVKRGLHVVLRSSSSRLQHAVPRRTRFVVLNIGRGRAGEKAMSRARDEG